MQEYVENVLIPDVESVVDEYPLNRKDQKVLCLFDVFAANRTLHFNFQKICISGGTSPFFPDKLFVGAKSYH
jgi:hypothetical protein